MEAVKKFGPQRFGQRNPDPNLLKRNAWKIVPNPQEIMVSATTERSWSKLPPISVIRTTGSTRVLDMRNIC
jgi:hypothetical protein